MSSLTRSPFTRRRRIALVSIATLCLPLTACGGSSSASGTSAGGVACPDGGLTFGVEPFEAPSKLEPAYKTLADALTKKLGCDVKVQIVDNYSAEVLAMRNNRLDLGEFGPLGYVFASQKAGAEPLASFGTADGKLSTYTAGIWVKKDSPIKTVKDLEGHSLALGSNGSTSGDALPRLALKKAGLADSAVKSNYSGGHPQALLALTHGSVDAAEINSQTLATATKAGTFKEADHRKIWTSEPIPNDPITVRKTLDPKLKTAIKKALLELEPEQVQKVASFLDVDPAGPMIAVTNDDYKPLFDLAKTLGLTEKDV